MCANLYVYSEDGPLPTMSSSFLAWKSGKILRRGIVTLLLRHQGAVNERGSTNIGFKLVPSVASRRRSSCRWRLARLRVTKYRVIEFTWTSNTLVGDVQTRLG